MEISGHILAKCPPEQLLSALYDVKVLERLMPMGSTLQETGKGRFAFSVSRVVGPIKLNLPGQLTLNATGKGHDQVLSLRAAHIIGGKVDLDLDLAFTTEQNVTRMTYTGALNAMGLSGRFVKEHRARVNSAIRSGMLQLKNHAQTLSPSSSAKS